MRYYLETDWVKGRHSDFHLRKEMLNYLERGLDSLNHSAKHSDSD